MSQVKKPLIIAHRGASGDAPENTLAAIRLGVAQGADIIEIDVHLSKDGRVVVIHDKTIDRTTNKKGKVKDLTYNDLLSADAGTWFSPYYKAEKIPLLEEAIEEVRGKAKLLIEIKTGGNYYPGLEKKTLEIVERLKASEWCIIHTFSNKAIKKLRKENTKIPIYKLAVGNVSFLPFYIDTKLQFGNVLKHKKLAGINPNVGFAKEKLIRKIKAQKQQVFVWTVNEEEDMKRLINLGVDGIITNYPDKLRSLLND